MFQYKSAEVRDFSGGFTDDVTNAEPNKAYEVKNWFVMENKTIRTRFGSVLDDTTVGEELTPEGIQRINTLINFNDGDKLLVHSGKNIYFRNPVVWTATTTPNFTEPLINANAQTSLSFSEWSEMLFVATDNDNNLFDLPIKLIQTTLGFKAYTAGLPKIPTTPTLSQTLPAAVAFLTDVNSVTSDELITTPNDHFMPTGLKVRFTTTGTLPAPLLPDTDYYFISTGPDTFKVAATLVDAQNNVAIDITSTETGTCTIVPQAGDSAYWYAIIYEWTYVVGDQQFTDFGPRTLVQITDCYPPDMLPINISNVGTLPILPNHYATSEIYKGFYRTIDGGQEFYKLGAVLGPTGFLDNASDAYIQVNGEAIYTTGGIPDNDPPPLCKFLHTVNGRTYYAHIKEGTNIYPSLIRQAQTNDPDSVPASFEDQLDDNITGLSSVQDIPIVGCRRHVYRIDGFFDELGRGGMSHRRISDHAGCVSHNSFVQAEGLLFWFGNDGIYMTEGLKCLKVSDHVNGRYKKFLDTLGTRKNKIKGCYNPLTRSIYWTVSTTQKAPNQEECDAIWVLDLAQGISENMTCIIWDGPSMNPTALTVFNDVLYRGDKLGYVLKFDETASTDPRIEAGVPNDQWFLDTIMHKYTTISSNFGSSDSRKIARSVLFDIVSFTNYSLAIRAINDEGRVVRNLTPIRYRKNFVWGDEDFVWGGPNFMWWYGGIASNERRMPAKGLRFNFLQLEIMNDFTNIVNSDVLGTVTTDATLKTITLDTPLVKWPSQSVDYKIYLEQDGFVYGFKVIDRTDTVLTVEDNLNGLVSGVQRWQLKGYKKGEVVNLTGINISYADTSRSNDKANKGDLGELT